MSYPPPFGSPDGNRLPREQLLNLHSVTLAGLVGGRDSRLIVGRPGVGKTCLLRELELTLVADSASGAADGIQTGAPRTSTVLRAEALYAQLDELAEAWEEIWTAAFYRSLVSKLLCTGDMSIELDMRLRYPDLLGSVAGCHAPVTVFSQVDEILTKVRERARLDAYLRSGEWPVFIEALGQALDGAPPWWLLLDLSDVKLEQAPSAWLACQHGLLRAIARLRGSEVSRHFKVIAATREAHYTRYRHGNDGVGLEDAALVVDTDEQSAARFCTAKLSEVDGSNVARPGAQGILKLVGRDVVINAERKCEEQALSYLIRHTRSTPRDVVIVGNQLAAALPAVRSTPNVSLSSDRIRQIVGYCASLFGNEQLVRCAQQLAAHLAPADSILEYFISATTSPAGSLRTELGEFIRAVGRDRFASRELDRVRDSPERKLPGDVVSCLWQNGLLGYLDETAQNGTAMFFALAHSGSEIRRPASYAFHPCLIDALGLTHDGASSDPIHPTME